MESRRASTPSAAPPPSSAPNAQAHSGTRAMTTIPAHGHMAAVAEPRTALQNPMPSPYNPTTALLHGDVAENESIGPDSEAVRLLSGLASGEHDNLQSGMPAPGPDPDPDPALVHPDQHSLLQLDFAPYALSPTLPVDADDQLDPDRAKAYAKLAFSDGDFFITTHDVTLGRNMDVQAQVTRRKRQEKRARQELDTYRQEPSQPSQPGDDDQPPHPANSNQSLEGRPAPPSNFSEQGGSVWYLPPSDNEADMPRRRPRRRVSHFSKSSSTTSVAPASLHTDPYNEPIQRTSAFIPIHTENPADMKSISKQHLMFSFNFQEERWELKIIGNRAIVNDELYERGTLIPLQHGDEIIVNTVCMVFKLPDNFRQSPGLSRGTFSKDSDEDILSEEGGHEEATPSGTSPPRRLSNATEAEGSESEDGDEDEEEQGKTKRRQPKLKLKTKGGKKTVEISKAKPKVTLHKPKKPTRRGSSSEASPTKAVQSPDQEKKAKTAIKVEPEPTNETPSSPPAAPFIKPGSVLEGIPLEELPEKRKGPGRPPKEGNVSKRDTQLANKKKKEYEKRGEEPPPFKELVNIVRRESKVKELHAKMEANGQLEPGQQIRPSIEVDANGLAAPMLNDIGREEGVVTDTAKKASPKPKRPVRALSPVKPESECTAEELKKPDFTYVYIIDQVLTEHPLGVSDLQEIYELIMKKYPYYKYRQSTMGWQSSVRHNLLQSKRFVDSGRSGKGKLWMINHEYPLEKEKRKRATPPPPRVQVANGTSYPMSQGQPAPSGTLYGQQRPNGQFPGGPPAGGYYPPYVQSGYAPQPNGARQPLGYAPNQMHNFQQQQQQPSPNGASPAPPSTPWDSLISEIVQFQQRHIAQFVGNAAEVQRQSEILTAITEFLSELYSDRVPDRVKTEKVRISDARVAFGGLSEIFRRHKAEIQIPDPWISLPVNEQMGTIAAGAAPHRPVSGSPGVGTGPPAQDVAASQPLVEGQGGGSAMAPRAQPSPQAAAGGANAPPQSKRAAEDEAEEPEAKRPRAGS